MSCPRCEEPTVDVVVPETLSDVASSAVSVCTNCLTVEPADVSDPDASLGRVSDAVPEGEAGIAAVLLADRLDSLATNRPAIERLVSYLEERGADPLLVLEAFADDPSLEPAVDLRRRSHQLEQLVL